MADYYYDFDDTVDLDRLVDLDETLDMEDYTFRYHNFIWGIDGVWQATLSATVEFAGDLIRQMYQTLSATVEFLVSRVRVRNEYEFEFTGNFPDGSVIVIDRDNWRVTLNGANMMSSTTGDLPYFTLSDDTLTYSDSEGSRTVAIKAIYRGRWL
jgi:hypothetical protein